MVEWLFWKRGDSSVSRGLPCVAAAVATALGNANQRGQACGSVPGGPRDSLDDALSFLPSVAGSSGVLCPLGGSQGLWKDCTLRATAQTPHS